VALYIVQIAQACRPFVKGIGMWGSVKALARGYEYLMGVVIFAPVAILAWFPFVSEFQTRLLFNQAFSRGLQIQRILAGGKKDKKNWIKPVPLRYNCRHKVEIKAQAHLREISRLIFFYGIYAAYGLCVHIMFVSGRILLVRHKIFVYPNSILLKLYWIALFHFIPLSLLRS